MTAGRSCARRSGRSGPASLSPRQPPDPRLALSPDERAIVNRQKVWFVEEIAALPLALLPGACDLGPDYLRPQVEMPVQFRATEATETAAWPAEDWWHGFDSRELNALVEQARTQNFDIVAAIARIRQADAQVRIAGAAAARIRRSISTTTASARRMSPTRWTSGARTALPGSPPRRWRCSAGSTSRWSR